MLSEQYGVARNVTELRLFDNSRVSKGISAQASHRTVLASLNAQGSSCCKNSKHYSLILLNSILFLNKEIVFASSNKQAKPFAPFPLQKLHYYYDLVRNSLRFGSL